MPSSVRTSDAGGFVHHEEHLVLEYRPQGARVLLNPSANGRVSCGGHACSSETEPSLMAPGWGQGCVHAFCPEDPHLPPPSEQLHPVGSQAPGGHTPSRHLADTCLVAASWLRLEFTAGGRLAAVWSFSSKALSLVCVRIFWKT